MPFAPQPQALGPAMPAEQEEPSLMLPILRQWWLVTFFVIVGIVCALAYTTTATPLFTSYSKIYIQPTSGAVVDALGSMERENYLSTQVEVIKSSAILNRVADTKGIRDLKTFAPANGNPVLFLREKLDVDLERKTDLIVVTLNSPYPEEACQIVGTIVDSYNAYCLEEKDDRSHEIIRTLETKLAEEDKALNGIQEEIRDFHVKNPNVTIEANADNVSLQKLQMISSALSDAQMKLIDAQANYMPGHPTVIAAVKREKEISNMYDEALQVVTRQNAKGADLQRLTSKLDQRKEFRAKLAERLHQLDMATTGQKLINIEVVEPARIAEWPSYPRKKRILAVAMVAGALLGAGLALLRDRRDGRMHSVEEIQQIIGLPILGVVPSMAGRRTAVARAMTVHLDPRSVVAEAYRTVRTAVYFGTTGVQAKTILITSPEPGDGKTTSASNLAIAIAQTGRSVLLLDADFRKPTQHKNLDVKDGVGLSSVLSGRESLDRAIQRTGVEGLDILPCGPIPANPSEILNSREFGELIDSLAARYDHILFDSPPVNAVTDARILGAVCDATILVLRADKSTRKSGEHVRNALLSVSAKLLGAIVNHAPNRKAYDVYGGSYYGQVGGDKKTAPASRRLAAPANDDDDDFQDRRDIA